jgi:hypothetical protein
MGRLEDADGKNLEVKDEGAAEPEGLARQYLQYLSDEQNKAKPEEAKPKTPPEKEEESDKDPEPEKLSSGDTLLRHGDNEFLIMPDGSKLAILNDVETENDLPVPLDQRLLMQDKDGHFVSVKYTGTKTSIPPIDEYRFGNGMTASVKSGIAEIAFQNGDKIIVDELGLVAVVRNQGRADVRPPINLQPSLEEMTVPKNPRQIL